MLIFAIILMMFAIALNLTRETFHEVSKKPGLILAGLLGQFVALPLATLALIIVLQPAPSIALGMIVVAACPGGNVSNFMSWAARGDVALSVSLTAASSAIATVWTPVAIIFWASLHTPSHDLLAEIDFDRIQFVAQTIFILAFPLLTGMTLRHFFPIAAKLWRRRIGTLGAAMLTFVIVLATIQQAPSLWPYASELMVPVVLHSSMAMMVGALLGIALRTNQSRTRSLTFEIGIQNAGLAVVILLAQMDGVGGAAAIAAIWGVWHFFSGGFMIAVFRSIDKAQNGI